MATKSTEEEGVERQSLVQVRKRKWTSHRKAVRQIKQAARRAKTPLRTMMAKFARTPNHKFGPDALLWLKAKVGSLRE